MAFSRIDTRDERLTALILGDLPNVVWTPTLSTVGAERTELQDNITFQIGTRFRYLGSIYELTAPMSIPTTNNDGFGWVYPNISTGQFEVLTTKRLEDVGVAASRPPIGLWIRRRSRQAFLPMNPNQDKQYPISINRDVVSELSGLRAIIVQDRAKVVLNATQRPMLNGVPTIEVLETGLLKNGESQVVSLATSTDNPQVVTASLDRGVWQLNSAPLITSLLLNTEFTLKIWGRVAIL